MKIVLTNIGTMVSGYWRQPFIDGDALVMDNGRLGSIGTASADDTDSADLVVDAGGMTAIPGLIDSHVHITFGDYTPRQKTVGFLESYLHGGITSCISASEIHVPGRPADPAGIAALALAAQRCFQTYRPGGMRVYGGSVIMEPGLTDAHFESLASEGVWLAKVGFGAFAKPADVTPIVQSAQRHGFKVMCHTGGASIPGSAPITADDLITMQPDIAGHCNGGPVALSDEGLERVVKETTMALQIAQAGNIRSAALTIRLAVANDQFDRVLISSDTPTGTGVMPLGVIKSLTEMAALTEVEPERIIATATGNCTRVYGLDAGLLKTDMAADVTLIDASQGCTQADALAAMGNGDIPAVAAVFSNGIPRFIGRSRNTPPPTRQLRITKNQVLQQFREEGVHDCC